MVNVGAVWGLVLAVIFILVIYKKMNKRVEKEVEVINVTRPEENRRNEFGDNGTKPEIDNRIGGDEVEGKVKRKWGIQFKSSKTNDGNESEHNKSDKGDKSGSIPYPLFKPFESGI